MLIESRGQLGREGRREESSNPNSIQKDNGFTPLLLIKPHFSQGPIDTQLRFCTEELKYG